MASKLVRIKQEDLDFIKTFEGKDVDNLSNIINFYKTFTETQNQSIMNGRPISRPEIKEGEEYKNWAYHESKLKPRAKDLDKPQSDIFFASILKTIATSEVLEEDFSYQGKFFADMPTASREDIIRNCVKDMDKWSSVYPDFMRNYLDWTSDFQQTIDARLRTLVRRGLVAKGDSIFKDYFWKGHLHGDKLNLDLLNSYINAPADKDLKLPKLRNLPFSKLSPLERIDRGRDITNAPSSYKLWYGKDEN